MRYSKNEVRGIVGMLDVEAKMSGLLPMDHKLIYHAGNVTNGVSATVVVLNAENQQVHGFDSFIPEFTYKTGPTTQARLLEAALNVFFALRRQTEAAARAARKQLEERGL